MSQLFTSSYLSRGDTCGITAYPFTLAGWVWTTAATNQVWAGFGDTDTVAAQYGYLRDPADSDSAQFSRSLSPATSAANGTSTQYAGGKWEHVCAVFASAVSRTVYLDGGGAVENTTSVTFDANLDNMTIGCVVNNNTQGSFFAGYLAEMALWSSALSVENITLLAAAQYPNEISVGTMVAYWPLLNDGTLAAGSGVAEDAFASYDLTRGAGGDMVDSPGVHPIMTSALGTGRMCDMNVLQDGWGW